MTDEIRRLVSYIAPMSVGKTILVIPARLGSTRLSEKVLADIDGVPMVVRVYQRACQAKGLDEILVATDHKRVADVLEQFKVPYEMTPTELNSGTERVEWVSRKFQDQDVFVNLQGDEPLIEPSVIEKALTQFHDHQPDISTVGTFFQSIDELKDPACVKALLNVRGDALYFSRFPIPYSRVEPAEGDLQCPFVYKHLGIYCYSRSVLQRYVSLSKSPWESAESLEQLRALYHGMRISVGVTASSAISVDTQSDLLKVRNIYEKTC